MPEVIAQIILQGMKIFSEERRRHLSSEYLGLLQAVKDAENAQAPDYNDAQLALAVEARDNFLRAYQTEFSAELDGLLKKVISNA